MAIMEITSTDADIGRLDSNDPTNPGWSGLKLPAGRDNGGQIYRGTVKFNFSTLRSGAIIAAASLLLTRYSSLGTAYETRVSRVLRQDIINAEVAWNYYKGTTVWGTAGCKNTTTDYVTTDEAIYTPSGGDDTVDVTAMVQYAQANTAQIIIFLLHQTLEDTNGHFVFYDPSKLIITYSSIPSIMIF